MREVLKVLSIVNFFLLQYGNVSIKLHDRKDRNSSYMHDSRLMLLQLHKINTHPKTSDHVNMKHIYGFSMANRMGTPR